MQEIIVNENDSKPEREYTLDQFWAMAHIEEAQRENKQGTVSEVVKKWSSLLLFDSPVILGSFSWYHMRTKHKFIYEPHARYGAITHTPADRAKGYLRYKGFGQSRKRVTSRQYDATIKRKRAAPLYAKTGRYDDMVYIDITSAYWSIMKIVGWDVDYHPNRWLGVSSSVSDFPYPDDKLARNCLASVGLMGNVRMWTGEKLVWRKAWNPMVNMMLWSLLQDTLHGIGSEMIARCGAVYVHTDGYIVPKVETDRAFDIISSWGLSASIRFDGNAIVRGAGDYDIGWRKSRRMRPTKMRDHDSMNPVSPEWLKDKLFRFSLP